MQNTLFPIFVKTESAQFLVVGGGKIGLEKAHTLLKQNPTLSLKMIAKEFFPETRDFLRQNPQIQFEERAFLDEDLKGIDYLIIAIDDKEETRRIKQVANNLHILVNAADQPELCDFYLGSIINKGDLKIAISTNGKSPVLARRMREYLNDEIPDNIHETIDNLHQYRAKHTGDLKRKLEDLNDITKNLSYEERNKINYTRRYGKEITIWFIIAILSIIVGFAASLVIPVEGLFDMSKNFLMRLDNRFYWMIFVGFGVEMIAGSMGMGYGVICTSILLSLGLPLPVISSSVHTSEMFGSATSAYSHYRYKNINKKLFKTLAIPGVIAAIFGALFLIRFGEDYAHILKPFIAIYTLFLGTKIFLQAFVTKTKNHTYKKMKYAGWLGGIGGFIDSVGGGGWGPLVTSTLIAHGRKPRYAVGSSIAAKFCITVASAFTFLITIGISQWAIIVGLIIGGVLAAPLAAKLTGKLPTRGMFAAVGVLVIGISLRTLLKSVGWL